MNVFSVVKDNVTAKQVAMQYGMKINRNGLACCPFHSDKTASMKIDNETVYDGHDFKGVSPRY